MATNRFSALLTALLKSSVTACQSEQKHNVPQTELRYSLSVSNSIEARLTSTVSMFLSALVSVNDLFCPLFEKANSLRTCRESDMIFYVT